MLLALIRGLAQDLCGMMVHQCVHEKCHSFLLFSALDSTPSDPSWSVRSSCARALSSVRIADVNGRPDPNVHLYCNSLVPAVQLPATMFKTFPVPICGGSNVSETRGMRGQGAQRIKTRSILSLLSMSPEFGAIRCLNPLSQESRSLPLFHIGDANAFESARSGASNVRARCATIVRTRCGQEV